MGFWHGVRKRAAKALLRDELRLLEAKAQALEATFRVKPWAIDRQVLLQELDQQQLDLLARQASWMVWGELGQEPTEAERLAAVRYSKHYYERSGDPIIYRLVSFKTDYGFGRQVTVVCKDPKAQKVWDEFFKDRSNRCVLGDRELYKLSNRIQVEGEILFTYFVDKSTGKAKVRRLPTEQVPQIDTDPDDKEVKVAYKRVYNEPTTEHVPTPKSNTSYYRDWAVSDEDWAQWVRNHQEAIKRENAAIVGNFDKPDKTKRARSNGFSEQEEQVGDGVTIRHEESAVFVMHVPYDTLSLRGWPIVARAVPWAEEYRQILEAHAAVIRAKSAIIRGIQVSGGSNAVEDIRSRLTSALQQQDWGLDTNPPPVPASTAVYNEAVKDIKDFPLSTGSGDVREGSMLLASQAAVAMDALPSVLGRVDAFQNRATARESMGPAFRALERYQAFWKSVFAEMVEFVLLMAEMYGGMTFTTKDVEIRMSPPFDTDLAQVMAGLGVLLQHGAITPILAAEIALSQPEFNIANLNNTIDALRKALEKQAPPPVMGGQPPTDGQSQQRPKQTAPEPGQGNGRGQHEPLQVDTGGA